MTTPLKKKCCAPTSYFSILLIPLLISGHRRGSDIVVTRVVFQAATVSCPVTNEDLSNMPGMDGRKALREIKSDELAEWIEIMASYVESSAVGEPTSISDITTLGGTGKRANP